MTDDDGMRLAIDACRRGIRAGQSPFGAAVAREGGEIVAAHNTVRADRDPTAHAEVNALREAGRRLATYDLAGCVLYSTCEPCPMCLAATHWANVDRVVFGASIDDAASAGFREMPISAEQMVTLGRSRLVVERGRLAAECVALFAEWSRGGNAVTY